MSAVTDRVSASDIRVIARLLAAARQRAALADEAGAAPDQEPPREAGTPHANRRHHDQDQDKP